ncbi:acetyl-CoA carboxylase, biotin carboxyl carrier protein [Enterococcus haemoperoxidus ATCC BAA-382]|uniref:Biotin carboxyl carrier protein of acetyl-CoA carboxylase n=1 Tax=Enterococcus haemoperoxidus ATCC BAA-382 TaxID=1158608 RepID=R2QXM4_9ENTE|nr:acetyl-CoA carboxylase biotin carboxyl carrier protein [Enterococcus haemoperoxidus]EOI00131.1 acetyl-CoA carboxylase, biotin carboxyl carrier protein [Enterococcus haemoperoxidus ATCC BAA-382]EOT63171.1 acetyl-CoA carboxylase, biotin carboxyl carrier protein [Enterococcus haemoperoxidus ATCC BAA-382]OJG50742.1 acetyl-CoA carboxylase, biotin carboxyl carrier protein [Enterococcus haemoperoxidus]
MNINEVKDLLTQFDESTLTEFDLREGSFGLYMNKNKVTQKTSSGEVKQVTDNNTTNQETTEVTSQIIEVKEAVKTETIPENTEEIISPIVGVVYLKPAPDKENFKQVGDSVKKGDVVCIVEAMKLMNEITATVDGVITEVLIQNEDVVEFNQPLFRVSKGV